MGSIIGRGNAHNHRKIKKHLFQKGNIVVSTAEMIKAVQELSKHLPPITEEDIELIKRNPSISFISKIKIIRRMKRSMQCQKNKKIS